MLFSCKRAAPCEELALPLLVEVPLYRTTWHVVSHCCIVYCHWAPGPGGRDLSSSRCCASCSTCCSYSSWSSCSLTVCSQLTAHWAGLGSLPDSTLWRRLAINPCGETPNVEGIGVAIRRGHHGWIYFGDGSTVSHKGIIVPCPLRMLDSLSSGGIAGSTEKHFEWSYYFSRRVVFSNSNLSLTSQVRWSL